MKRTHLLLIGNGEIVFPRLIKSLACQADFVLAVDGGADKALAAGIVPQGVIGDLDSVSLSTKRKLAHAIIPIATQENTDLEKALSWAVQHHFTDITLVGFVGDRWDFSIGNLCTLARWACKLHITVAGDKWRIYPLVKSKQFFCKSHKRVSLIPLKTCTGVTLTGLA